MCYNYELHKTINNGKTMLYFPEVNVIIFAIWNNHIDYSVGNALEVSENGGNQSRLKAYCSNLNKNLPKLGKC